MSIEDIDLVEINEAFASVVLAWEKELHADMDKVNVNGGPSPSATRSGLGIQAHGTLLNELERTGGRWAWRRCAKAAAWPTPPSSSAWADRHD